MRSFRTDQPSKDRNSERGEPERTGTDRLLLGTKRTGFTRSGSSLGPDQTGLARTRPDWTGPTRPGPDWTGPACGLGRTGPVLCTTVAYLDQNRPDLTRPDHTGPGQTRPDRTRPPAAWNGMHHSCVERQLIWTATDQIRPDQLQLGTEQTDFMRNGICFGPDQTGPERYIPDIYTTTFQRFCCWASATDAHAVSIGADSQQLNSRRQWSTIGIA